MTEKDENDTRKQGIKSTDIRRVFLKPIRMIQKIERRNSKLPKLLPRFTKTQLKLKPVTLNLSNNRSYVLNNSFDFPSEVFNGESFVPYFALFSESDSNEQTLKKRSPSKTQNHSQKVISQPFNNRITPSLINTVRKHLISTNNDKITNSKTIKIHTGSLAQQITKSYEADALTLGQNIFFSQGKFDPTTPKGLALLAHEITHIEQQEDNPSLQKQPVSLSQKESLEEEGLKNEREVLQYFVNSNLQDTASFRKELFDKNTFETVTLPQNRETSDQNVNNSQLNLELVNRNHVSELVNRNHVSELVNRNHVSELQVTPFLAEKGRAVESKLATAPSKAPGANIDLNRLAEQIYELIEKKIKMQRERRGFR